MYPNVYELLLDTILPLGSGVPKVPIQARFLLYDRDPTVFSTIN